MFGLGVLVIIVAVIATAFALGGGGSSSESGGASSLTRSASGTSPSNESAGGVAQKRASTTAVSHGSADAALAPAVQPQQDAAANSSTTEAVDATSSVTATRVVKTGSLSLTVGKGLVQSTISKLIDMTTSLGGYVAQSRTDNIAGSPSGEVTLRMPVAKFETAVSQAQHLGHETSLSTTAHDVTGKVVDLNARVGALRRTRSTYLTILARTETIGQTLSVQQRVEDVQQQIEQLQGQLKVLRNQSADSTLTVDVSQVGAPAAVVHHHKGGIGAAWHTSMSRFSRGFDAIVSALGPLLLALIILGIVALIGRLSLARVRRATS
jgi:hypothetical protein